MGPRGYSDSLTSTDHKINCGLGQKKGYTFHHCYHWMPQPLLGRDLLTRMKAQTHFSGQWVMISLQPKVHALCLDPEEECRLISILISEVSLLMLGLQHSVSEVWAETNSPAGPSHSCLKSKCPIGLGKSIPHDSGSQIWHH